MNKLNRHLKNLRLTFLFAVIFFLVLLLTMLLDFALFTILLHFGFMVHLDWEIQPFLHFLILSLSMGTVLYMICSHFLLRSLRDVMHATDKIADGDYSVRVAEKGPLIFQEFIHKFNHMAEEINSVELLRNNFINDFSHEFKTPIVSIRGFAKLLRREDLTPEERNEYLDIIITESERLTALSENILNLSKLERQSIVADRTTFNVSEQIRRVIAMLDSKWSDKHIDFIFDSGEISLCGNEMLLQQVWLNLLDNAIKFSPDYETVELRILPQTGTVRFEIVNYGEQISKEELTHIFDKFYQGDPSHTTKGNGLGLTIAKRIVELHKGCISAQCDADGQFTFTVELPC